MNRKPVIGLIGGIGAGKTAAGRCLAARGGFVIDADKLGHVALDVPDVKRQLVALWGERVLNPDGTANRRTIAGIVFDPKCPVELASLEAIVFPVIGGLADAEIQKAVADPAARFVVLDAAVLLEVGWGDRCDRVLYIDAPRELRERRLAGRSGWTPADLTAREAAQWPADVKKARADAVVVNDGTPDELQAKLDTLLTGWGWMT